jgi:hypothetical protein
MCCRLPDLYWQKHVCRRYPERISLAAIVDAVPFPLKCLIKGTRMPTATASVSMDTNTIFTKRIISVSSNRLCGEEEEFTVSDLEWENRGYWSELGSS